MKGAKYDVGGTMYLDWITNAQDEDADVSTDKLIAHFQSTETPLVTTNTNLASDDPLVSIYCIQWTTG